MRIWWLPPMVRGLSLPNVQLAKYFADEFRNNKGIRSAARAIVDPKLDGEPRQTGFAVYRATVPVEKMRLYPELDWVLQNHNLNVWYCSLARHQLVGSTKTNVYNRIGEGRHVMTYAISGGNTFNMVLSHRDYTEPSTWKSDNILNDIKDEFSGWDPQ